MLMRVTSYPQGNPHYTTLPRARERHGVPGAGGAEIIFRGYRRRQPIEKTRPDRPCYPLLPLIVSDNKGLRDFWGLPESPGGRILCARQPMRR
jgi:hypothetical protein